MHTFLGSGCRIHYHGDYSGEVIIRETTGTEISVPASDLLDFVAKWVASEQISRLESAASREVLGIDSSDRGG